MDPRRSGVFTVEDEFSNRQRVSKSNESKRDSERGKKEKSPIGKRRSSGNGNGRMEKDSKILKERGSKSSIGKRSAKAAALYTNRAFDPNPELDLEPEEKRIKQDDTTYIPVRAVNNLDPDLPNIVYAILLPIPDPPAYEEQEIHVTQSYAGSTQPYAGSTQPYVVSTQPYIIETLPTVNGDQFRPSETPLETISSPEERTVSRCWIFLRVFCILFFAIDNIQDLFQMTDLFAIDILPANKGIYFTWSSYFRFFYYNETYTRTHTGLNSIPAGWNCAYVTDRAAYAYAIAFFIGSSFTSIRMLNIIGESLQDAKCCRGFRVIHGWTETFLAVLLEDGVQCSVLFLFAMSCKRSHLNYLKFYITLASGFVKNVYRLVTCRIRPVKCKDAVCDINIGCFPIFSCIVCYKWIWCGNDQSCTCKAVEWDVGVDVPLCCTCGRLVVCGNKGLCGNKQVCCKYTSFSCFSEKNDDPHCSGVLVSLFLALQLIVIIAAILAAQLNFNGCGEFKHCFQNMNHTWWKLT